MEHKAIGFDLLKELWNKNVYELYYPNCTVTRRSSLKKG